MGTLYVRQPLKSAFGSTGFKIFELIIPTILSVISSIEAPSVSFAFRFGFDGGDDLSFLETGTFSASVFIGSQRGLVLSSAFRLVRTGAAFSACFFSPWSFAFVVSVLAWALVLGFAWSLLLWFWS